MKIPVVALLLAALLLAGCGATMAQVNSAAGSMEQTPQSSGNVAEPAAPDRSADKKNTGEQISKDQAVEIALKHAGFKAEQVKHLRTEYEMDDGVPRYEVQFLQDRWEYDYEINAETGDIMSWDRDD